MNKELFRLISFSFIYNSISYQHIHIHYCYYCIIYKYYYFFFSLKKRACDTRLYLQDMIKNAIIFND